MTLSPTPALPLSSSKRLVLLLALGWSEGCARSSSASSSSATTSSASASSGASATASSSLASSAAGSTGTSASSDTGTSGSSGASLSVSSGTFGGPPSGASGGPPTGGSGGIGGAMGGTTGGGCAAVDGGLNDDSSPAALSNTSTVVADAQALLATLSTAQTTVATDVTSSATILFPFSLAAAEQWTNLPGSRHGLRLNSDTLTDASLDAVDQLVHDATSPAGYHSYHAIRLADNVLAGSNSQEWGYELYSIAFIGAPSTTSPWMLQLIGHHLAYTFSYNTAQVSASPMFLGVEPPDWVSVDPDGGVGTGASDAGYVTTISAADAGEFVQSPLEIQRSAVWPLVQMILDGGSAADALLSGTFTDVVMGAVNSSDPDYGCFDFPTGTSGRGLVYSALTAAEQAQVNAVIEAWVGSTHEDIATVLLAEYESATDLASTYVGWGADQAGGCDFESFPNSLTSPLDTQHSYLRIDGPHVWIEIVVQQGVAYTTHVHYHSIWRDKSADYGGAFH